MLDIFHLHFVSSLVDFIRFLLVVNWFWFWFWSREGPAQQPAADRIQEVGDADELPAELLRGAAALRPDRDLEFRGHPVLYAQRSRPAVGLHQEHVSSGSGRVLAGRLDPFLTRGLLQRHDPDV